MQANDAFSIVAYIPWKLIVDLKDHPFETFT